MLISINLLADIVGLTGVSFILIAYFLLQTGKIAQRSFTYSFVNLCGAVLILLSLFVHWNLPSVVIEIFWIMISLYGLSKWLRSQL